MPYIQRIFTEGNQFIIEDAQGKQLVGLSKDVLIRPVNNLAADPEYYIEGVKGWAPWDKIKLSEIADVSKSAYSLETFKTFYQNELGKDSAGSAAATTLRIQNQTLTVGGWVLDTRSNVYEYSYFHEAITESSEPEIIPLIESADVVGAANIYPYTSAYDGEVVVYAQNIPTEDIIVDIIVRPVQDV
jgi:hypothetical protein